MKSVSLRARQRGFALVVTLSLMIMLTVIAVGLLSLSAVTLRSSSQGDALAIARANARVALMLAIGELQQQAGPDQRVSATASRTGTPPNPNWTGVWRADQDNSQPVWLVSGDKPDPIASLPPQSSVALLNADPAKSGSMDLRVPLVKINQSSAGGIGWWVGDEGVKARVDLAKPRNAPSDNRPRLLLSQSSLEPGLLALGSGFEQLGPDTELDKKTLISMRTLDFASSNDDLHRSHFDDLTSGGFGLPVNVAQGRLKTDLSILFDRSQQNKTFSSDYLGAKGNNGLPTQTYTVSSPEKFYFSDTIRTRVAGGTGPNWGILWNYARLWKNLTNQQMPLILSSPVVSTDPRTHDWLPYKAAGTGATFNQDTQHTNSPVTPVISHLQIGFRLQTRPTGQPDRYQLQMQIKPVVGIWNPYNVPIAANKYIFDWGVFPWLRYGSGMSTGGAVALPPDTDPTGSTAAVVEVWMREQWKLVESSAIKGRTRFTMETDPVDLQPGEFRLFSVSASTDMSSRNRLRSAWNEEGAYVTDLIKANGNPAILTGTLPNGTPRYIWIGDMFLDDVQKAAADAWGPSTRDRFPDVLMDNATHGFLTFKANNDGGSITRCGDIWNTGTGTPYSVPERILSGATTGTFTKKAKYKITDLALPGGYEHLATWAFFLRPTTQIENVNANQRLRGWVDANPRSLAINPRWEGSVAPDGKRQGWNLTSALIGGAHGTGLPAQIVGDGGGGNRGLVAEAREGSENIEPQIGNDLSRYQGLGGASNTAVGGQSHVMIYDVPRTPLVSIGQFQHAQLSRYSFEPGFVVGNSYADLKIPLEATIAENFNGFTGHQISDISHEVNKRLWDDFYFSTFGLDYQGATGNSFDSVYNYSNAAFPLANPRMWFVPESADDSIDKWIRLAGNRLPEAISSHIRIAGAFNINSTSKTAWKAVLSSMGASELPRIDPANTSPPVWENPKGVRFNRFGHVATADAYKKGGHGQDPAFWLGWRELEADELDKLADEIVKEVKARGPFRSLAEFVNRNPSASNSEHRRKGPLQAAIDRTVNLGLPASVSDGPAQKPSGPFSNAIRGESQAVGHAGYLMQGDLLQSLGPILQARSDYFRVRAYGEARDAAGKVIAQAWCEAFVQRGASYVDPSDKPETHAGSLTKAVNQNFGRRFDLVSFRWLTPDEI
jgi:hypothetical protein